MKLGVIRKLMSKFSYQCRFCGFECQSSKERVKCLDCNKMGLVPKVEVKNTTKESKTQKVKSKIFTENKWSDDGNMCAGDKWLTEKLKQFKPNLSSRPRNIQTGICTACNKEFRKFSGGEYLCNDCGRGR